MKMRPVGAELFYEDGQSDTMKQLVTSHNFVNVPKNGSGTETAE